jgi:hypothetical protein
MRRQTVFLILGLLLATCASASAQTGRRLALGAGPSWHWFQDDAFSKKNPGIGFLYRFSWSPHKSNGWHLEPAVGFTVAHANFGPDVGGSALKLGSMRSIPLLVGGGPSYRHDRTKVGFTAEVGPSFHKFTIDTGGQAAYEDRTGTPLDAVDAKNSVAVRVGPALWYDLSTRFGLRVGTSYLYERPEISETVGGVTTTKKWKADYLSASAGLVVGFF